MEVGIRSDGFVEIVDVGSVVLVVMKGHRLGIDIGLEGIGCVGERGEGEGSAWEWGKGVGGGRGEAGGQYSSQEELEEGASFHGLIIPVDEVSESFSWGWCLASRRSTGA